MWIGTTNIENSRGTISEEINFVDIGAFLANLVCFFHCNGESDGFGIIDVCLFAYTECMVEDDGSSYTNLDSGSSEVVAARAIGANDNGFYRMRGGGMSLLQVQAEYRTTEEGHFR